jgi:dCTP deaminase
MKKGVVPSQTIREFVANGVIHSQTPISTSQIQPASIDVRLGSTAIRVRASFLAGSARKVSDRVKEFEMHSIDLSHGAGTHMCQRLFLYYLHINRNVVVLEKGCVYVIQLMEHLRLPKGVSGVANAKSSTGRLDLLTRLITDHGTEFDRISDGYCGPLFAEVCPRSFTVLARSGVTLNQLRFRQNQSAVLNDDELRELHRVDAIVDAEPVISDGLSFSVDLKPKNGATLVGYRAKPHTGLVDLGKVNQYDVAEFWDELHTTNGQIILDPGQFYILVSRESVVIPPSMAAEMEPFVSLVGEFRVHYAGFFDPGFGVRTKRPTKYGPNETETRSFTA